MSTAADLTCTRHLVTPVGTLVLVATASAMKRSEFLKAADPPEARAESNGPDGARRILEQAAAELQEYFGGRRRQFTVPLEPEGTDFQRRVWNALREIPYGETWSYGQLARHVHNPGASRAVGGANNRNPLPVLIPCHRVIGADGTLVGFGGGLDRKRFLLKMEREHCDPAPLFRMTTR